MHTRNVACTVFEGPTVSGTSRDIKSYGFENTHRGYVDPGAAVHDIRIRLTIDDDYLVYDVEPAIESSPRPFARLSL